MAHPGGRPTEYNQAIIEKTREYLNTFETLGEVIPSIEGLAVYLDLARSTIYDWIGQEDKQEFSDIVEKILAFQGKTLANKGLKGEFNPTIAKLMLSKHGYKDSTENETKLTGSISLTDLFNKSKE